MEVTRWRKEGKGRAGRGCGRVKGETPGEHRGQNGESSARPEHGEGAEVGARWARVGSAQQDQTLSSLEALRG